MCSFQQEEIGKLLAKNVALYLEQQEDNSKGDICYLENIFDAAEKLFTSQTFQLTSVHYRR